MSIVSIFRIHREYTLWDDILPVNWTDGTAILSTGAVKDNVYFDARDCNKLMFYIDFTVGGLAYMQFRVLFSPDRINWYQKTTTTYAGGVLTGVVNVDRFAVTGRYRISFSI
ncbi:unnamed protein product, partial [marine sediment metagenome]